MTQRMPVIFFGHGNPMNALAQNKYTAAWRLLGTQIPWPKAILSISAHWYGPGTAVTAMQKPRTIHDFGGFPDELFAVQYAAPGNPALAQRVQNLLAPTRVILDYDWGLDHGTWSVLCHVFPDARIPVVQLSMNENEPASFHYELAGRLAPLRDEGILIIGSGNIVHNLHAFAWGRHAPEPFDWATRFETHVRERFLAGDHAALANYEHSGKDALLSAPTPEHYLPFLYVAALRQKEETITFPVEGVDGGSISMLSVKIG